MHVKKSGHFRVAYTVRPGLLFVGAKMGIVRFGYTCLEAEGLEKAMHCQHRTKLFKSLHSSFTAGGKVLEIRYVIHT